MHLVTGDEYEITIDNTRENSCIMGFFLIPLVVIILEG